MMYLYLMIMSRLTLHLKEATKRAKDEAELQSADGDKRLTPQHLVRVLPKVLMDF